MLEFWVLVGTMRLGILVRSRALWYPALGYLTLPEAFSGQVELRQGPTR